MEDPFLLRHTNAAELHIIRHGDAIPETDEIIPGGIYDDLPLSAIGRVQAEAVGERLNKISFDAIYSSPLKRCLQTAAPLVQRTGLQPTIIPGIKEIQQGELFSLKDLDKAALTERLRERQEHVIRLAGTSGSWDSIEGSESSKAFRKRVVASLDEIARNHIGQRVAIFAHGGVVNAYVAEVLGLEKDFFYPAANTSITVVRVADNHRVLFVLNDFSHVVRHA